MKHVRPYVIFNLLDSVPADRIATVKIPYRRDLKLLETFLLITALRLVNAKRIFEFGTFFGSTTLNLALNSPDDAKIFTLDVSKEEATQLEQDAPDEPLTKEHLARLSMEFDDTSVAPKITRLTGNSRTFDFSSWKNAVDLVFVDGGHGLRTVESDTENAFRMARTDYPACIFWHDYRNPDCSGNTYFLDELSKERELFHAEDTMLCGWFNRASQITLGSGSP
jgi:hypothetical protein